MKASMKTAISLYEGETFYVVESPSIPFFRAYGRGNEKGTFFWGITASDLMATLRKNKPEWAQEIDMAGD